MKSICMLLAVGILFSCGSTKIKGNGEGQSIKMKAIDAKSELGKFPAGIDEPVLKMVKLSGNTLTLDVTYTGGCAEHDFRLVGSQMISKSMPPIRAVKLVHDAHGDTCKATVTRKINFDLTELAYQKEAGSEIVLQIEGLQEPVRWTYK